MTTTHLIRAPDAAGAAEPSSDPRRRARRAASELPTLGTMPGEIPLIGVVAVAGPPVILLAGPWLLFVLLLIGPVLLLATLAVALVAATVVVALTGAILATPYLAVRYLYAHRPRHAFTRDVAAPSAPVDALRVSA